MFAMSCQKNIVAILMIPLVGVICCISYHAKKMPRSSTFADMTTLMTTPTRVPQKKHNYFNTSTTKNTHNTTPTRVPQKNRVKLENNHNDTVQKASTTFMSLFKPNSSSIVKEVDDDTAGIPQNCKHLPSSSLHKCRTAISHALKVDNITCPSKQKCVTFDQYGRLNNFITELNTAVVRYVLVNNSSERKNIHISSSLISILNLRAVFDEIQLSKVCVSFSFSGHCEKISAYFLHKQNLWHCNDEACLLASAWLSFASLKSEIHTKVSEFIKYGKFSSVHARFLEDQCEWRHKNPKFTFGIVTTPDYCRFEVSFIIKELKKLGHRNEPLWLCSDRQRMHKVGEFINNGIAKISPFHVPVYDSLLMINSEFFVGNAASTLSLNVYRVRSTFGKKKSQQILL